MSSQIVPLTNAQNQSLSVQLTVDSQPLTLTLSAAYSAMAGYWQLAIADVNGNSLISSVPLITGLYPSANLLAQYGYLKIGSAYLLNTGSAAMDYPDQNSLNQFSLLWGDTAT